MTETIIHRKISIQLHRYLKQFRVVSLTGPRQSGKTSLLKNELPNSIFFSLEDPQSREFAIDDPKRFINNAVEKATSGETIVIDEAQYAPKLFSYIQLEVDESNRAGQFVLSGSQNFILSQQISQSLAGRVGNLYMLPLEYHECKESESLNEVLLRGFYPEVISQGLEYSLWYSSYVETYLQKDVRNITRVGDLNQFLRFLKICAARTGNIVNLSEIGSACGVSHTTIKNWLSVLEASFIIKLVQPFHKNFNKRQIKSPKLFFLDTGLCLFLLGIRSKDELELSSFRGAIFETFVYSELLKKTYNIGEKEEIYYWREKSGVEVDFILERANTIKAIEVKASHTIRKEHWKNLSKFKSYPQKEVQSILIYAGDKGQSRDDVEVVPWDEVGR